MWETLYPYLFTGILLSLVWWFFNIHKTHNTLIPSLSFFALVALYGVSLVFTNYHIYYKLGLMLPRDVVILLVVFLWVNQIKKSTGFFFTTVLISLGCYLLFSSFLTKTFGKYFNQSTENQVNVENNFQDLDVDAELMFDIKNENSLNTIQTALSSYDIKIKKAFPDLQHNHYSELDDYYLLDIPQDSKIAVQELMNLLYKTGAIDWVELNEIVKLSPLESSPSLSPNKPVDYGINDPNIDKMWSFEKMQVAEYYNYLRKSKIKPKKKAKIAILDTGVDSNHEDIKGNYVSTQKKYDSDKQSHGTHCAGISAAVSNNALGVASLALDKQFVEVTSIKVLSDYGWGTQDDIIRGIIEAADAGADVISMSLGGPARATERRAYEEAVKYANKAGAIVVVAAGNSNKNAKDYIPASCKGVICVSAIDNELNRAKFSNTIEDIKMGIAAPGVDILSTVPDSKYAAYSGTSMATPYVAGLLGIMKSLNPDLNTESAYQILTSTGLETLDTRLTGKMIYPLGAVKKMK
jgi:thermitase